jgi:hypothetical protein
VISASRSPRTRVIQPWISAIKTLPTPSPSRSAYGTPVLPNRVMGQGRVEAPSQPPTHPAGTKTWAACSREHSNQQSPHDLKPYTPQSARLRAPTWGASQAPVVPVARQRVRRRASRSSLRCSLGLGVGKSAGPTRMPWLPRALRGEGWWRNQLARAVIWVAAYLWGSELAGGEAAGAALGRCDRLRRSGLSHHPAPPPGRYRHQTSEPE